MPYEIYKKGANWCVRNKDTGENEGCSNTKEDAVAMQRALYRAHDNWKPTDKK